MANESDKALVAGTPSDAQVFKFHGVTWGRRFDGVFAIFVGLGGLLASIVAGWAAGSSSWNETAFWLFQGVTWGVASYGLYRTRVAKIIVSPRGIEVVDTFLGAPIRRTTHSLDAVIAPWDRLDPNPWPQFESQGPPSEHIHRHGITIDGTSLTNLRIETVAQLSQSIARARAIAGPGSLSLDEGRGGALSPAPGKIDAVEK